MQPRRASEELLRAAARERKADALAGDAAVRRYWACLIDTELGLQPGRRAIPAHVQKCASKSTRCQAPNAVADGQAECPSPSGTVAVWQWHEQHICEYVRYR
jgi:hypothetical protein